MLFSSNIFLFCFLPLVLVAYFVVTPKLKNYVLLLASLFFYAWGEPKFVFVMIGSIIFNYTFGILVNKFRNTSAAKICMGLCIAGNLGVMFIYKYLNFAISTINPIFNNSIPQTNIILPIGISFFTFQAMSYVIDVFRGDVKVQKNPFYVGLYVSFFPQLIAGPIVRYSTIEDQIINRKVTLDGFSSGVRRFLIGLSKKVLLANTLAVVADKAFATTNFSTLSIGMAWLGALCYAFQIFFDFSGYSDMAIGLGAIFGFTFLENFNYPYISKSVSEFWRRWHISLGTWFRDYVYFPLGGSRVDSKFRLVFNLFVVWFLTGVWHGANWTFIVWGLIYFIFITLEKLVIFPEKFKSKAAIWSYELLTLLLVLAGWVIFRSESLKYAVKYMASMAGLMSNKLIDIPFMFYLRENWIFLIFAVLCSTPIFVWIKNKFCNKGPMKYVVEYGSIIWLMGLFLLVISYFVIGFHNPFIYFNF